MIKFFSGETANMKVFVKENDKELPCGAILLNNKILEEIKEIVGEENIKSR